VRFILTEEDIFVFDRRDRLEEFDLGLSEFIVVERLGKLHGDD
jgi:hypothetical protein